jgi:hypothetical protein
MILDDIISLLNESFRNAHVTDNEPIDRRIIQDWIMLRRNTYIKNYFNQKGTFEQNALQFELLDVELYDPALIMGGISLDKRILRSDPCPTLIEGKAGVAVYEITTPDMISRTIQSVPMDRLRWCGNGTTNFHTLYAAFYDGRFYLKSGSEEEKGITKIRIVGVFADPTQVSTYIRATDDYPSNDYHISYMINEIQSQDFSFLSRNKSDNINNATGDLDINNNQGGN